MGILRLTLVVWYNKPSILVPAMCPDCCLSFPLTLLALILMFCLTNLLDHWSGDTPQMLVAIPRIAAVSYNTSENSGSLSWIICVGAPFLHTKSPKQLATVGTFQSQTGLTSGQLVK